jgi:hypothetical protein
VPTLALPPPTLDKERWDALSASDTAVEDETDSPGLDGSPDDDTLGLRGQVAGVEVEQVVIVNPRWGLAAVQRVPHGLDTAPAVSHQSGNPSAGARSRITRLFAFRNT